MRHWSSRFREPQDGAVHASRTAGAWRPVARGLGLALLAAVFLAFTGAFGSGEAPWLLRFAYWLTAMTVGAALGALVSHVVLGRGWLEGSVWLQGVLVTLLITGPLTVAIWALTGLMFGDLAPRDLSWFILPVLVVSAAMTALNTVVSRRPKETHAAPAGAPPSRFLERLPPKLRGAELYAVESEDHYLRLHTSWGSDLILMRLADAVAELEGIEGAQTHRSWWVARGAVQAAARGDGRAVLTLRNGAAAPVSRTYAKALREAGWF